MQHAIAECMDRLHLEPAGGLKRLCEQPPRGFAHFGRRRAWRYFADRRVERIVVESHPVRQCFQDLVGHVGGGGLGESEAKDPRRRIAAEQEPDHSSHEHGRLARAGIGRHPG